jgi:hypothetical protein
MRISLRLLKQKLNLVIVVAIGVAAGGITTAAVMAAEPDSNGQVNACYDNTTQVLSANESGGSCPGGSTALNWDSGQPVVKDANGQVLGTLLAYNDETNNLQVFNHSLNRQIDLFNASGSLAIAGTDQFLPYFADSFCSGQAYISDPTGMAAHTKLFKTSDSTFGTVPDSTDATSATVNSYMSYDPASDNLYCNNIDGGSTDQYYAVTPVSLPFTTPLALPLHY